MPYRHAHLWLVLLAPTIVLAFWPGYFAHPARAAMPLHAHGITASLWLALLAVQSWSIHARRGELHRLAGLAVFVAVPLFAAAGALVIHSMSVKVVTGADPFTAAFGARLAMLDLTGVATFVALTAIALAERRRIALHAGGMLATALLVLPPVVARLPFIPAGPIAGWTGLHPFVPALHIGHLASAGLASWIAWRAGAAGRPFAIVAAVIVLQSVAFETVARTPGWTGVVRSIAGLPPLPLALAAMLAAAGALMLGWRAVPARPRRAPAI